MLAAVLRRPWLLLPLVVADAAAELLTDLLKLLIPRHRPFVHQLGSHVSTHSFPSGHTATSFACATVLSSFAPRLRVPFFVLAAAIAFSRLYNGDHFPLDVLAGAVLGVLVGAGAARMRGRGAPPTTLLRRSGLRRGWWRGRRAG